MKGKAHDREWGVRDEILRYTCQLAGMLHAGRDLSRVPDAPAPFPKRWPGERFWAQGGFTLFDWRAVGDGSWHASTPVVAGTGAVGTGLMVGSLIGGGIARRRARRAAAAATVPRWVPIGQGVLYVSQYGFYMHTPRMLSWDWESVTAAQMVGPGQVHISGNSDDGPVSWLLASEWAELVFITWALTRHPDHVQLAGGAWLPPGWVSRTVAGQHYPPQDARPLLGAAD